MPAPLIVQRGQEAYESSYRAMRAFTDARAADTPDQLWIVEHPPVFTLGLGADRTHVLDAARHPAWCRPTAAAKSPITARARW